MSILNPTTDAATNAANQVRNIIRQQFLQLGRSGVQGFNLIWHNPNGVSPVDVVNALSTDASAVFQLAQLNISTTEAAATIGGVQPPSIPAIPDGYAISFNQDGSAVVTMPQPPSSSSSSSMSSSTLK